jgi:hypothetical protein
MITHYITFFGFVKWYLVSGLSTERWRNGKSAKGSAQEKTEEKRGLPFAKNRKR